MGLFELMDQLMAQGWHKCYGNFSNVGWYLHKRFPNATPCCCNHGKNLQLEVVPHRFKCVDGSFSESYVVELQACVDGPAGDWVQLKAYGRDPDLGVAGVSSACNQLLLAWEAVRNDPGKNPPAIDICSGSQEQHRVHADEKQMPLF